MRRELSRARHLLSKNITMTRKNLSSETVQTLPLDYRLRLIRHNSLCSKSVTQKNPVERHKFACTLRNVMFYNKATGT